MKLYSHTMLAKLPLCRHELNRLKEALPQKRFSASTGIKAYVKAGGSATNLTMAYQSLVNIGKLPDVGLIWKIAGITFREQPPEFGLRQWADKLGPDTWEEARTAAIGVRASYAPFAAYSAAFSAASAASAVSVSEAAYRASCVAKAAYVAAHNAATRSARTPRSAGTPRSGRTLRDIRAARAARVSAVETRITAEILAMILTATE